MNDFIFVPITSMLNRMSGDRHGQKIAFMNVQVRDVKDMDKAMAEVSTILRRMHGGVEDYQIVNRADQMRSMQEQGRIYDVTFLVCGTISLLVGGIVIMNILLASFNERVREVGTRKALGATGLNIMAQFLVESVVVTILGGLLGVVLGGGLHARHQQPDPAAGGAHAGQRAPGPGLRGGGGHLLRLLSGHQGRAPQSHPGAAVRVR